MTSDWMENIYLHRSIYKFTIFKFNYLNFFDPIQMKCFGISVSLIVMHT